MAINTKTITTNGDWAKVEDLLGISLTDNTKYSVQVVGSCKLSYSSSSTITGYFLRDDPKPFTYEKKSGEDFYINANNVLLTVAE